MSFLDQSFGKNPIIHAKNQPVQNTQIKWLIVLFFISGFSALCYQVIWQRNLFATFGINIESVTIIVSLFMLGLGLGSVVGGKLQRYPHYLLSLFILFEVLIGIFGLFSQSLIFWLGSLPHLDSLWMISLCVYTVFALPTLLMGATLPILVGYINRYISHTGKSISWLYASNTFGAVVAAYGTVQYLFTFMGLSAVILLAVFLNLLTALLAFLVYRKTPHKSPVSDTAPISNTPSPSPLSYGALLSVGFALGYISLSQEIIWYRILGFMSANRPQTFALLLSVFLSGIALASIKAAKIMETDRDIQHYMLSILLKMLAVWFISFPLLSYVAAYTEEYGKFIAIILGLVFAGITAYLSGGIFPILGHLLQHNSRESAGSIVSKIYFANVLGATAGPLLTGFVIFEYFPFQHAVLITGLITVAVILWLIYKCNLTPYYRRNLTGFCLFIAVLGYGLHNFAYDKFLEKLQFGKPPVKAFDTFNYNRSGFISVSDGKIYGNGAYDGMMIIDPENNQSGIIRAYAVTAFHPNPKRILQIGLSGGSWAKALSMYKPLEEMVSVEINKGYLDVIQQYPDHTDILTHPKINIVIDDGRRWLRNHPDEKFDVITMNTTYHWRSNATNLLSREFLEMSKNHLNPGGYIFLITTESSEVVFTAAHVFNYVSRAFGNMIIAGDVPSNVPRQTKIYNLRQFTYPDGQPVFKNSALMDEVADITYPNERDEILKWKDLLVITDDNMATEFKKYVGPRK